MTTLRDLYDYGWSIEGSLAVLVVDEFGEKQALSCANVNGGECDCCCSYSDVDSLEVLKVVDLDTMIEWDLGETRQ